MKVKIIIQEERNEIHARSGLWDTCIIIIIIILWQENNT